MTRIVHAQLSNGITCELSFDLRVLACLLVRLHSEEVWDSRPSPALSMRGPNDWYDLFNLLPGL